MGSPTDLVSKISEIVGPWLVAGLVFAVSCYLGLRVFNFFRFYVFSVWEDEPDIDYESLMTQDEIDEWDRAIVSGGTAAADYLETWRKNHGY